MSENVHIADLVFETLKESRRITVPSFGTFIRKENGETVFSQLLSTDDGVLRRMLNQRIGNALAADAALDRFLFEVNNTIDAEGYCLLGGYGRLAKNPNGSISFHAAESSRPAEKMETGADGEAVPADQPRPAAVPAPETEAVLSAKNTDCRKKTAGKRRRADHFIIFAIVVIVLAVSAMLYGLYVKITTDDLTDAVTAVEAEFTQQNLQEDGSSIR